MNYIIKIVYYTKNKCSATFKRTNITMLNQNNKKYYNLGYPIISR